MARSVDGGKQMFTRANDFGFSKNPEETLEFWDKDAVLSDVVWAYREVKPDVVINRFYHDKKYDTHGHHTASAMLSVEAFDLAAKADLVGAFATLELPRVAVRQPVLRQLDLPAFRQFLAEQAVHVANAVAVGRDTDGRHGFHEAGGEATKATIAERRIAMLIDSSVSRLPPFLTANAGLNSGFMIAHVTAASLASENKSLAHPASVDSLPTSANQEDHVSMAANAATKARRVVLNLERLLAIEFMIGMQALEFRSPLKSSPSIEKIKKAYRTVVPKLEADRVLSVDMDQTLHFLRTQTIITSDS